MGEGTEGPGLSTLKIQCLMHKICHFHPRTIQALTKQHWRAYTFKQMQIE